MQLFEQIGRRIATGCTVLVQSLEAEISVATPKPVSLSMK